MEIIRGLSRVKTCYKKCILTIGVFDGLHRGHQKIIKEVVRCARVFKRKSVIITFESPLASDSMYLSRSEGKHRIGLLLSTPQEKIEILKSFKPDLLIILRFSKNLVNISAEEFVKKIVLNLAPSQIIVGTNHTFGKGGRGNPSLLKSLGKVYGFKVRIFNLKRSEGEAINSTEIRKLIRKGDVRKANFLLGRYFSVQGRVIRGSRRGTSLGFPTANLKVHPLKIIPMNGVYAGLVRAGKNLYRGLINVGCRPTFTKGKGKPRIEIFLQNFRGNLYGHIIKVEFVKRIRDEKRFLTIPSLKNQIERDLRKAKTILSCVRHF